MKSGEFFWLIEIESVSLMDFLSFALGGISDKMKNQGHIEVR